jgi:hypothetical protein
VTRVSALYCDAQKLTIFHLIFNSSSRSIRLPYAHVPTSQHAACLPLRTAPISMSLPWLKRDRRYVVITVEVFVLSVLPFLWMRRVTHERRARLAWRCPNCTDDRSCAWLTTRYVCVAKRVVVVWMAHCMLCRVTGEVKAPASAWASES